MRICIPVLEDKGLESRVSQHFGSAPAFMIVDVESGECRAIANNNRHHQHGMCQPLAAIAGESVDSIVVGGIGMGALMKLQAAKIAVFRAECQTVGETLEALKTGTLRPVDPDTACGQHRHQHGHLGGRPASW
jgi:predicted Fe-Mo cluster-binding NifX family protein